MSAATPSAHHPLSDAELDRLSAFLGSLKNPDAMDLETLDGFFCALVAGPETVMPSEYLPLVWGGDLPDENAFATLEEANAILQLIMRHWNSIITDLETDEIYLPLIGEPDERGVAGRPWARGFMRGVAVRPQGWKEMFASENEGQLLTIPMVAGEIDPDWPAQPLSDEKRDKLVAWMAAGLARSYRHFAPRRRADTRSAAQDKPYRRSTLKVGRNNPCPCGSGKKFKHCCGASNVLRPHLNLCACPEYRSHSGRPRVRRNGTADLHRCQTHSAHPRAIHATYLMSRAAISIA